MTRQINEAGLALIKASESCRLEAYQDAAGVWTIGWGHTGLDVHSGLTWSQQQADSMLALDCAMSEASVDLETSGVPTSDNQFSAMVSLAFNIGRNAFCSSSVLHHHLDGDYGRAAESFGLWNKIRKDGKLVVSDGLVARRRRERNLYLTGTPQPKERPMPSIPSAIATPLSVTTAAGVGAGSSVILIDWIVNGCPHPVPIGVSAALAGYAVPFVHLIYIAFARWLGVSPPPLPGTGDGGAPGPTA